MKQEEFKKLIKILKKRDDIYVLTSGVGDRIMSVFISDWKTTENKKTMSADDNGSYLINGEVFLDHDITAKEFMKEFDKCSY